MLAAAATLTACSGSAASQIDYVVDGTLATYNTNTVVGAASAGAQAFARTLTGFGYHGPDGQVVADHDFGTISVVSGAPLVLDYQIADNAVYSDGKPVTCDDLVLAWAAQSGRYPGFDAATRAGYVDIANIECLPGQKKARVSFNPGPLRRRLHPAVRRDLDDAVARHRRPAEYRRDGGAAEQQRAAGGPDLAAVEHHLGPQAWVENRRSKHFPSSGPYKIESVLDGGAVVLVANDRWWGPRPITKRVTVWPQGPDIQDRVNSRSVRRGRRRRRVVGSAGHPGQLRTHRFAVGRDRAADLRRAGTAVAAARPPRVRAVHAA